MVWLLAVNSAIPLLVLLLVLWPAPDRVQRLRLAGILGCIVLGGFAVAALTRGAYGGALIDPVGGVPPLMGLDANAVVFTPALVLQVIALILAFRMDGREAIRSTA